MAALNDGHGDKEIVWTDDPKTICDSLERAGKNRANRRRTGVRGDGMINEVIVGMPLTSSLKLGIAEDSFPTLNSPGLAPLESPSSLHP